MQRMYPRWVPFALWAVPAALMLLSMSGEADLTLPYVVNNLLPFLYWASITTPIIEYAWTVPIERLRTWRGCIAHLWRGILAGAACGTLLGLVRILMGMPTIGRTPLTIVVRNMRPWAFFGLIFYALIASIGYLLRTYQQLRERELATSRLETNLAEARLGALRMQLHPHFLFNTLNTVAMYIREGDRETSIRAVTRLSELLRRLLEDGGAHEVPLSHEIEHARKYLEIETLRFSDRLTVEFDVPATLDHAMVPNLVLQPLIENAIRHGIGQKGGAGSIVVKAAANETTLTLDVVNNGPPIPDEPTDGIGLANTKMRLQHLYGDKAHLRVFNRDGHVISEIELPLH